MFIHTILPPAVCSVPTKPDNGMIVSDGSYFIERNAIFTCVRTGLELMDMGA